MNEFYLKRDVYFVMSYGVMKEINHENCLKNYYSLYIYKYK